MTGPLLDKFFGVRVSIVLFLTTVAGVLLLSRGTAPTAFAGVAMIGFAAGGESDITPYLLSRYFSLQSFSTLYGLAWTAYAMGTAVGPVLMGKLYTWTGSYQSWGIQLLAVPTLLSAASMAVMPPYPVMAAVSTDKAFHRLKQSRERCDPNCESLHPGTARRDAPTQAARALQAAEKPMLCVRARL